MAQISGKAQARHALRNSRFPFVRRWLRCDSANLECATSTGADATPDSVRIEKIIGWGSQQLGISSC